MQRLKGRFTQPALEPAFDEWYRHEHPRLIATLLLITGDLAPPPSP